MTIIIRHPCVVTGEEIKWDTAGSPDACQCGNCHQYLKPPDDPGDPQPVTVPEGDDPWAVLRTMGKFMPGTERGECEIMGTRDGDPKSLARGHDVQETIGLTILLGHPERIAQPVFDCRTRVVEVVELAVWLKTRGYEASACQWNQPNAGQFSVVSRGPAKPRWKLITGKAQLPPLPSTAPDAAAVIRMDIRMA